MPSACALVILSCDAYRDLWAPCLALYRRYWPDCPYPVFLVSETRGADVPPARLLQAGPGLAWSDATRAAIQRLECEYVLLMLDDFFLTRPVPTRVVEAKRRELDALQGAYLRLGPWPRPTRRVPGAPDLGEHEPAVPYRASLQAAFWRRDVLLQLLEPGESAWEFEWNGSVRSAALDRPFYSARRAVLRYAEVLAHGKWARRGLRLCRREGLTVDPTRPVLSVREALARFRRRHWRGLLAGPMSFRLRRRIGQLARRPRGPRDS